MEQRKKPLARLQGYCLCFGFVSSAPSHISTGQKPWEAEDAARAGIGDSSTQSSENAATVGVPGVPAGTAQTGAAARKLLTQRVVQPIYIAQLDSDPWLALVAWDGAIRGQEDQKRGGHCGSLKAHLCRRARGTLRACTLHTAFMIPNIVRGREREGQEQGKGVRDC